MKITIDDNNISDISYQLKQIYYTAVIEQEVETSNSILINTISEVIEENNELLYTYTKLHSNTSYSINFDKELVDSFLRKVDSLLKDIYKVAYKFNQKFQNSSDIMAVVVPYVLGKISVTNDEILLFIGLAIALSKIVIDSLAKKYEENIDNSKLDVELKEICLMNLELLKETNCTPEIQKYTEKIRELLENLNTN